MSQKKNVNSELNKSELIEKLTTDPIIGKMKMKEIENGVLLKTSITWKFWGEVMKIILQNKGEIYFDYQISSSPKFKTTIINCGKNLDNVSRLESLIKKIA